MDQGREKDHNLALKVMRLTKPSLMVCQPVTSGPRDIFGTTLNDAFKTELSTVKGLENFGLSELLTLPQNFGNIFLGETFSSYISIHNDSQQLCKDIVVKADLQTSSQRLTLSSHTSPVEELVPGQSIDEVIHHEVKELGTHILVCAVSYTSTSSGEKMYFRKFFKFQVLKPLDVKTKFYNADSDEVYLEAQIQNITPGPIYMEQVSLDPSNHYNVIPLNQGDKENERKVFGRANYMDPMDVRQYLYCLVPKPETAADIKLMKGVTNIGKLDIVWKTNIGEKGRLQTSALQRAAPGYGDIRLSLESIPDVVTLEKTFNVTLKIANCSERPLDLVLVLKNQITSGLLWCGISGKALGKLAPNSSVDMELTLIAVRAGLQTISGLQLTDTFLQRTYEHDEIAQVFVYSQDE